MKGLKTQLFQDRFPIAMYSYLKIVCRFFYTVNAISSRIFLKKKSQFGTAESIQFSTLFVFPFTPFSSIRTIYFAFNFFPTATALFYGRSAKVLLKCCKNDWGKNLYFHLLPSFFFSQEKKPYARDIFCGKGEGNSGRCINNWVKKPGAGGGGGWDCEKYGLVSDRKKMYFPLQVGNFFLLSLRSGFPKRGDPTLFLRAHHFLNVGPRCAFPTKKRRKNNKGLFWTYDASQVHICTAPPKLEKLPPPAPGFLREFFLTLLPKRGFEKTPFERMRRWMAGGGEEFWSAIFAVGGGIFGK